MKLLRLLACVVLCSAVVGAYHWLMKIDYHGNQLQLLKEMRLDDQLVQHRVLLVGSCVGDGGAVTAITNHYVALRAAGIPVVLLTVHESVFVPKLKALGLPVVSCNGFRLSRKSSMWQPGLEHALASLVDQYKITIIHLNGSKEAVAAGKVAHGKSAVRVVYTHHLLDPLPPYILPNVHGVVGVGESICVMVKTSYEHSVTPCRQVLWVPPFFNPTKMQAFSTQESRYAFFKRVFNIDIDSRPVLCMLAHFYRDVEHKNQPLLLRALEYIEREYHESVQVIFAGEGESLAYCKDVAKSLGVSGTVHFVGATSEIAGLLYHSDINILTSSKDAFGIAVLEGGIMQKPTIISSGAGSAGTLVKHGQTGLVFKKGNYQECAEMIMQLIKNPAEARAYGQALYQDVIHNYTQQAGAKKLIEFYGALSESKL